MAWAVEGWGLAVGAEAEAADHGIAKISSGHGCRQQEKLAGGTPAKLYDHRRMPEDPSINEVIEFAMGDCMSISAEKRERLKEMHSPSQLSLLEQMRSISESPSEIWTTSGSLQEAAARIESRLRAKYPQLSNRSIQLLLSHAAFSRK